MTQDLQAAIDGLYEAFEQYRLAPHVPGCPHCTSAEDDTRIHSAPLRQLGAGDSARFAFKTMTTWGTVDDFRHFLPRICELLAVDGGQGWIDPEVALGKLAYGDWHRWPPSERRAIEGFMTALWATVSRTPLHPFEVDSCLCSFAQAADDLRPCLDRWRPDRSLGEASQFANWAWDALRARLVSLDGQWRLRGPWWNDRPTAAAQAAAWVLSPDRVAELETAFFAFETDDETATAISEAARVLSGLPAVAGVR